MSRVFVTGGSGFIGGHAILRLLGDGHEVVATIRSLAKADASAPCWRARARRT